MIGPLKGVVVLHDDPLHAFKMNGVSLYAIRLRAFPFSLKDKARKWLLSQLAGSFTNWAGLSQTFLAKYFPFMKIAKLRLSLTHSSKRIVNHSMMHGKGIKTFKGSANTMAFKTSS